MTMDKSLRVRKGASNVRGVLTLAERIARLKEQDLWVPAAAHSGCPRSACRRCR